MRNAVHGPLFLSLLHVRMALIEYLWSSADDYF